MEKSINIRSANKNDTKLILDLILELAAYEKLEHEVVADEKTLYQSLFVDPKGPEVLIAHEGDNVAGFVLFFHNFSTFLGRKGIYIEDLYIRPAFRSRGYGEQLIQKICQLAKDRHCGRVEWWVLDWNQKAIDFYRKIGAKSMDEWTVFRLNPNSL